MTELIKLSNVQVSTGSPYIPSHPGQAGRPGYFATESVVSFVPKYESYSIPIIYGVTPVPIGATLLLVNGTLVASGQKIAGYTQQLTTIKTWVPEQIYIAPTPAQAAKPPVTVELNVGWNGGADTLARFKGSSSFSFTIPANAVGVVVGLTSTSANGDYRTIPHGLYANRGKIRIVENGTLGAVEYAYTSATPLALKRDGSNVVYSINGLPVKTIASTLDGQAFGTAALYAPNDAVNGLTMRAAGDGAETSLQPLTGAASDRQYGEARAVLEPIQSASKVSGGGSARGVLEPLAGLMEARGRSSGVAYGRLESLAGAASGGDRDGAAGVFQPLIGLAADRPYAAASGSLQPLESLAFDGMLKPEFTASLGSLAYLTTAMIVSSRTPNYTATSLQPLASLAADQPYAEARAVLEPLQTEMYSFVNVLVNELVAPSPTLRATGFDATGNNAAILRAPSPTLSAHGGGNARLRAPRPQLTITGTATNFGAAELTAPSPTLEATGTVSGTGSTDPFLAAPMAKLVGYGGALASITLTGKATVQASGTTGSIGRAAITAPLAMLLASATGNNPGNASLRAPGPLLRATGVTGGIGYAAITGPLFELVASGTAQNYGSANLIAPSPQLGATAQAYLIAPMGRLEAIGTATVLVTASSFEAYATNLLHTPREGVPTVDEVTRYTNYPFTHIVRYQGSYFGANSTGLYLLEGTTDDGAPITYDLQTHPDTLGHPAMKTAVSAYLSGRIDPELTAIVVAGEDNPQTYSYDSPRGATAQTHRVKFGRGVKDRYLAIGLSGNGVLELDAIELEISNLKRRI